MNFFLNYITSDRLTEIFLCLCLLLVVRRPLLLDENDNGSELEFLVFSTDNKQLTTDNQ